MLYSVKEPIKENYKLQKDTFKFSVLISVYKKEKAEYLKQALQSVIDQTLKPSEIVIVKDGILTIELDECIENFQKQ